MESRMSRQQDYTLKTWEDFHLVKPERNTLAEFVAQMAERITTIHASLKNTRYDAADSDAILVNKFLRASIECYSNPMELQALTAALPKIKKFTFDQNVFKMVASTMSIPPEEIVGQLANISLPFDKFWIESSEGIIPSDGRVGYMITANPEKQEFSFQSVSEVLGSALSDKEEKTWRPYAEGKRGLYGMDITVRVSPYDGIKFDEDKFLTNLEKFDQAQQAVGSINFLKRRFDVTERVDEVYRRANLISRVLVVLGSDRVPNNMYRTPAKEESAREAVEEQRLRDWNMARRKKGQPLIFPVTPIKIDLTQLDPMLTEAPTAKEARLLLGWTSVRRSKPITSKYGKVYSRKPHDRRIPAPVDHRDAVREITARDPNRAVEIVAGRPVQVRQSPQSGNGNMPN